MQFAVRNNKLFITALVLSVIFAGMTFGNLPVVQYTLSVQTVGGETFNFADYPALTHEELALFNYLDELVTGQDYGLWEGWNAGEAFNYLLHYVLAFMAYATAELFETASGYRTDLYQDFAYSLIKKMNTTVEEYPTTGEQYSIEYTEWMNPSYNFVDYYWPEADNSSGLYVGGFRGPANIMWTGHYALMMALYERSFWTGEMYDELSWFVSDWNNTLMTDGYGNSKEGGIFDCGLIPCEPYIVFVQCNSIPIFCTVLYDNMFDSGYFESGMWDYGFDFINNVMQDQYDLFADGYYTMRKINYTELHPELPQPFPGLSLDRYVGDGRPKVSSYGDAWSLTFLEYMQENETKHDYPIFMEYFARDVTNDQMYMMDSYNNPSGFGVYDMLGTLFTLALAKQQGDFATLARLVNFLYEPYNRIWSADGRQMYFDTSSLVGFLQVPLAFGYLWANAPVNIRDLADSRPTAFWSYPYISQADDDSIWVYQAVWDDQKDAFVLNVRVDATATLSFSNFDHEPTAYAGGVSLGALEQSGADYTLTLAPGTYNIVIL